MNTESARRVGILLATYNGARFVEQQIVSLKENETPFVLHWVDDHSSDDTREAVYRAAHKCQIEMREWQLPDKQGYPGTFLYLMECVDADIYLFCDQDDIWQPGKIDATVANLLDETSLPALCFSDPLMFNQGEPETLRNLFDVLGLSAKNIIQPSRAFTFVPALGNTIGVTRPLRDLFMRHSDIARAYAFAHDWWMYIIALSSGSVRLLSDVPTTLWRQHGNNYSSAFFRRRRRGVGEFRMDRRITSLLRHLYSRQAEGFVLASATLSPGPKLERLLAVARLVATLDRQQSAGDLLRLVRLKAMTPRTRAAFNLAASCLWSDATWGSQDLVDT